MDLDRRTFLGGLGLLFIPGTFIPASPSYALSPDGTLTIGMSSESSSMDPHWHIRTANSSVSQHLFDRIVHLDMTQSEVPGLAESWRNVDDLTWEFTLREGATFHNGDPVTVEDLIFSYERAQNVPGAIFNLRAYLGGKSFEKVDDRTLRVITEHPNPIVPRELSTTAIISKKIGETALPEDYNSGAAAIGSGPFKFVNYVPGEVIELERNDDYWGEKPDWARVVLRPIPTGGSRVAALQSGGVNVIDTVPPSDVDHLEEAEGISLGRGTANRMIFLFFDHDRDVSPYVTAKDGSEIPNPFKNQMVRDAFDLAIDKKAIAARILSGNGAPAEQLVPAGIFGHNPDIPLRDADTAKAKDMLAEAGYPDGFKVTLHGPNDRFIRDASVMQAAAQMLARIGIEIEVDAMPANIFYKRASTGGEGGVPEFSFFLVGYGAATGEVSAALRNLIHTYDKSTGFGSNNRGRYSNPALDAKIEEGMATVDDDARLAIFRECCAEAMADIAVVPLYYPISVWGMTDGIDFDGRSDERTLAMDFHAAAS
ncbi:ABC transporter substrate-binding protein [Salipiger abyssi]|uniref:Peptide/nickel transport system substrate-binding protein n=1 Tax=Salipiger abyssi TaxID=1250539 RepID=A0A1P8V154_9RHOB|nr:ABC transporter substrate-binding protein [Salipiger abyssi]APZ55383.1 peptide/nickel transport system substrate-binding protein [Salipiger abyssi]